MQQLRSKGVGPIGEQREWSVQRALFHSRGREPLAIGGNIIDDVECTNPHRFLRYGLGSSDREVVLAGCYLDSHQNAIQSGIEELSSIAAPAGRLAAGRGNLPSASWFRKVGNINFGATGLVCDKGDPTTIRRDLAAGIGIRCVEQRIRFVVAIEGIDLDFRYPLSGRGPPVEDQVFPIRGPGLRALIVFRGMKRFFFRRAVDGFEVEVGVASAGRGESQLRAVWGPDKVEAKPRFERKSRLEIMRQVVKPNTVGIPREIGLRNG